MANSSVLLFDPTLNIVDEGEICISGPGLAIGYFKNDNLTLERFFLYQGQRFYRTGDYARREGGELKFLGRHDALIKNRGFLVNVEEQIIPIIRAQNGVESATAFQLDGEIVAFVTPSNIDTKVIRDNVAGCHDTFVVPDRIYALDKLPITPNGKLDKRRLRDIYSKPEDHTVEETETEPEPRELTAIRVAVSKSIHISPNDVRGESTFWELGGNSLSAIAVLSELRSQNISVSIGQLLGGTRLKNLCNTLASSEKSALGSDDIAGPYPISHMQQLLVRGSMANSALNYVVVTIRMEHKEHNNIDGILRPSWQKVLQRHAVFRTEFSLTEGRQYVLPCYGELDWETIRVRNCEWETEISKQTQNLVFQAKAANHLNPPTIFRLITIPHERSTLLWLVHHARIDGWSVRIVIKELQALLDGHTLADAPQFAQASNIHADLATTYDSRAEAVWSSINNAARDSRRLPFTRISTPCQWSKTCIERIKSDLTILEVEARARNLGVSTSALMYGAWALVLMKYTGSNSATFGSVFSGRELAMPKADKVVGPMLNVLPFSTRASNTEEKSAWLRSIQKQLVQMSDLQWSSARHDSQPSTGSDLRSRFDTLLVLQYGLPEISPVCNAIPGLWSFQEAQMSEFVWTLLVEEDHGCLALRLLYDELTVTAATTQRALSHFENILQAFLIPDIRTIHGLKQSMLGSSELISLTHHSKALHEIYHGPTSLKVAFEIMVDQNPDVVAVESPSGALTYRELDRLTNYVGSLLLPNASPGKTVAVLSDGSLNWLFAVLSVVKTGATYCPIDVNLPRSRGEMILELSQSCMLIVPNALYEGHLKVTPTCTTLMLGAISMSPRGQQKRLPDLVNPQDPVCLVFTSGTTGKPKGVHATHLGLLSYISFPPARLRAAPQRRIAQTFSVGFDACAAEIFGTLCYGATLVLKDPTDYLANLRVANGAMLTPSLLSTLHHQDFSNLDTIVLGGEAVSQKLVSKWLPGRHIYNGYGPCECTVGSLFSTLTPNTPITLGRPLPRMSVYVLDRDGAVVPIGIPGEIYLTGVQVTKGYMICEQDEPTRFLPDPFNIGNTMFRTGDLGRWTENMEVEFLGRRDRQVKVRGFRVNLEEVETALLESSNQIHQAAVIYSNNTLTAFVAPADVPIEEIVRILSSDLPAYSRPSRFIKLDWLPQTTNQKTDYSALLRLQSTSSHSHRHLRTPSTPMAQLIAAVWKTLFKAQRIPLMDIYMESDFLELGGHSLLQIMLARELTLRLGRRAELQVIIENTVLSDLAEALTSSSQEGVLCLSSRKPFLLSTHSGSANITTVSLVEKQVALLSAQCAIPSAFHIPVMLTVEGSVDCNCLLTSIRSVFSNSRVLRSRYEITSDEISRIIVDSVSLLEISYPPELDNDLIEREINKPFELGYDQLLRLHITQTSPGLLRLLVVAHHCVMDGTALRILLQRIQQVYLERQLRSLEDGTEMGISRSTDGDSPELDYLDWVEWNDPSPDQRRGYFWKEYLQDRLPLKLPINNILKDENHGGLNRMLIAQDLADGMTRRCKESCVSKQQLAMACIALALQNVYGVEDFILAIPFANRSEPGTEALIGLFLDILPVRIRLDEKTTKSVEALVTSIKQSSELALANYMPYNQIQGILETTNPVFDVMVSFHATSEKILFELPNCTTTIQRLKPRGAKFPLMFEFFDEGTEIALEIEYIESSIHSNRIDQLSRATMTLLESVCRGTFPAEMA